MTLRIHVATTNRGKLRDFALAAGQAQFADGLQVEFLPLPGLETIPPPVEDQDTFEGNARLKAEYYSSHAPGLLVLADDSGLEVDALEGRPGVRSARFAEDVGALDPELGQDGSNNAALLLAMLEQTDRRARYRCVLALALTQGVFAISEGSVEGELLTEPEGSGGFGYDPLFLIPELRKTMAQVGPEERLRYSHRARALRTLLSNLPADLLEKIQNVAVHRTTVSINEP